MRISLVMRQGSLGLMPIRLAGKEPGAGCSGMAFGLGVVLRHGIGPISLPRVRRLLGSFPTALCPAPTRWPPAPPAAPRDAPILQGKRPRLVPAAVVLPLTSVDVRKSRWAWTLSNGRVVRHRQLLDLRVDRPLRRRFREVT